MAEFPRKAAHFAEWSKLMLRNAVVPERLSQKKSRGGGKTPSLRRRKRFRKRKRSLKE